MSQPLDLALRPYREGDLAEFVRIDNAAKQADGIDEHSSAAGMANWLLTARAQYDPSADLVIAAVGEAVAGYGVVDWVDTSDGKRAYRTRCVLDPACRRQRIGTALLAHNEGRLREIAASQATDRPRVFGAWAGEGDPGRGVLLAAAGYRPVRYFFDMLRPDLEGVDVPPLPDGIQIQQVAGRDQMRLLFEADVEAFRDHWGGFDASDAAFEQWLNEPNLDPSLFVVAWDDDQIAGAVINTIDAQENEALDRRRGLLDSVFVRRLWRRRGLAAALVGRSLVLLRERGMTSAWLGVDAENPTGALGIYERAGFQAHRRSTALQKPMELRP